MKNKRKSAVANQNGCSPTSAVEHDTYIYQFADGTLSTLVFSSDGISDIDSSWLSELQELDRLEYNNNHAQTRRHCSLDAQDPEGMGGYYEGDNMNFVQFDLEVEEFLSTLPTDLEVIALYTLDFLRQI